MKLLDNLLRRDLPVDTNLRRIEDDWDDDDRGKGKIYDPNFVPSGGWDSWCEWAGDQGKMAHIIHSRAKNAMSFTLTSKDPQIQAAAFDMIKKIHLRARAIDFFSHRDVFGRCFIEPVWTTTAGGKRTGLDKIKNLYPPSIRVFRDNEQDVMTLKDYLENTDYAAYALTLAAGTGDTVIGYVQHWEKRNVDAKKDKAIFFRPDELIFIPRYPSSRNPDGLSLLKQNYVTIMNKLGIEKDQAIMAKRHGDPKHKFTIPDELWHTREVIKKELMKGIRAGLDFFFKGRRDTKGDKMDVDIVEPRGNPIAIIQAQKHIENEFNASMGWADSFTESGSSNRSVGYIQLAFFERNLEPERQLFAEILEDELIDPWLKAKGLPPGMVQFKFSDLTPEDRLDKARIIAPMLPYLPSSVIKKFLEEMGYPVEENEKIREIMRVYAATRKGIPKPVLRGARSAREQFKEEIEAMKEDIEDVLGM